MISLDSIRQRKIFQWAVAYLAGAWLLLQLLDLLAQPFGWPDVVLRAATVLLAVGFFAVLVVAWYHGEQGRQKASGVELLMLAGILLIAGTAVALVSRSTTGAAATPTGTASAAADAAPAEQGSIAVLPFVNMSSDPEQDYFSDGLTEELLNVLAQIPELRVAARTSAFSFKGKDVQVDSIGRALRVAHVLEGSVRKSGNRVRITAQLIDAGNGFHIWSDTYNRGLEDVFAVQDEISRAIVAQLRLKLTGGGRLARQETADPEAHTLVLRGIAAQRQGRGESLGDAERLFREAVRRDPRYARAYASLAGVLQLRASRRDIPAEAGYTEARAAAQRAVTLDPQLSDAHAVLGRIADTHDWDFAAAEEHFSRAVARNPGDARALSLRAWLLMRLGRSEESLRDARRSVELDPLSMAAYNNLGAMYSYAGEPELAAQATQAALAIAPDAEASIANLALVYSDLGRHADAMRTVERALGLRDDDHFSLATAGYVYGRAGRRHEAGKALAALIAQPEASSYLVAMIHAGMGNTERAFEMLERAVADRDDAVPDLGVDPVFSDMRSDPRMVRLLRKIGLPT